MKIKQKFRQLFIAYDQLANATIGLFLKTGGWADETISARAWRERNTSRGWGFARKAIDLLFFWQLNHCEQAYESEKSRMQIAPEYRPDLTEF